MCELQNVSILLGYRRVIRQKRRRVENNAELLRTSQTEGNTWTQ